MIKIDYDPENKISDIKAHDVILVGLFDSDLDSHIGLSIDLTHIGYIYRSNGICYMRGLSKHNAMCSDMRSVTWTITESNNNHQTILKSTLMFAMISAYKYVHNIIRTTKFYVIKDTKDLEEFVALYQIGNKTFIREIRDHLSN